ncbi:hypothetical protein GGR50DRAFT_698966 [Xylaria sp. CBS 124048]|nr:hypothetical protein GGR50DRAFT_698966 [Xylaria sp. CBS 124048]
MSHLADQQEGDNPRASAVNIRTLQPGPYTNVSRPRAFSLREPQDLATAWPVSPWVAESHFSSQWRGALENMTIEILEGVAQDRYVRWTLSPSFYAAAGANDFLRSWAMSYRRFPQNPIYVEASGAAPWGEYLATLVRDPRHLQGLFIQQFGKPNRVMCRCCERRHVRSGGSDEKRGLWPFWECVSIPSFASGACGNCTYSIQASKCTWHGDDPKYQWLKASDDRQGTISRVNPQSSPSIATLTAPQTISATERRVCGAPVEERAVGGNNW